MLCSGSTAQTSGSPSTQAAPAAVPSEASGSSDKAGFLWWPIVAAVAGVLALSCAAYFIVAARRRRRRRRLESASGGPGAEPSVGSTRINPTWEASPSPIFHQSAAASLTPWPPPSQPPSWEGPPLPPRSRLFKHSSAEWGGDEPMTQVPPPSQLLRGGSSPSLPPRTRVFKHASANWGGAEPMAPPSQPPRGAGPSLPPRPRPYKSASANWGASGPMTQTPPPSQLASAQSLGPQPRSMSRLFKRASADGGGSEHISDADLNEGVETIQMRRSMRRGSC